MYKQSLRLSRITLRPVETLQIEKEARRYQKCKTSNDGCSFNTI